MQYKLIIDPHGEETVVATVHQPSALTDELERLVTQHADAQTLTAYGEDEIRALPYAAIECITVEDGKTIAIDTEGTRWRLRMRLFEVEERLPACFIRLNKSAIANRRRIARFTAAFSGAVDAQFMCGYTEYVSRRCFSQIKKEWRKP